MEMNIGFGANEKYVSTSLPLLKAWEIHDVQFDGVEYAQFDGKKDPTAKYEFLESNSRTMKVNLLILCLHLNQEMRKELPVKTAMDMKWRILLI